MQDLQHFFSMNLLGVLEPWSMLLLQFAFACGRCSDDVHDRGENLGTVALRVVFPQRTRWVRRAQNKHLNLTLLQAVEERSPPYAYLHTHRCRIGKQLEEHALSIRHCGCPLEICCLV